jgi:hypothetical protein
MPALGSAIVDVGIGLVFMYLLLSLIVSVLNELITQSVGLRANTLEQGLVRLLEGDTKPVGSLFAISNVLFSLLHLKPLSQKNFEEEMQVRAQALKQQDQVLAQALNQQDVQAARAAVDEVVNGLVAQQTADPPSVGAQSLLRHKLIVSLSSINGSSKPSYIPSRQFALALIDLIAHDQVDPTSPTYVASFRAAVNNIQDNDHLKKALLALIDNSTKTFDDLRANIEHWFDDAMDRVSGWYKRKVTIILFFVGLALTMLINADTLGVAQTLWVNPSTRSAVVAAAQDYVSRQATPTAAPTTNATPSAFETAQKQLVINVKNVESSQLPLGWRTSPLDDWQRELVGLLITAFAITLGAPFWFDLLSLFMTVRSSGDPPAKSSNGSS